MNAQGIVLQTWACSNFSCRVDRYKGASVVPLNSCPLCCSPGFLIGPPPPPSPRPADTLDMEKRR